MFNSKEYEWNNVEVVMLGKVVTGIRGVTYKESQEKEPVYGRGNKPRAIQAGNKTYEGKISLLQSELEALQDAAGVGASILDISSFDVTVAYVPKTGGAVVVDIIKNVEFTEVEKGMKQGDKFMEIELPIVALDIESNV
jgi:hypothetical protein